MGTVVWRTVNEKNIFKIQLCLRLCSVDAADMYVSYALKL